MRSPHTQRELEVNSRRKAAVDRESKRNGRRTTMDTTPPPRNGRRGVTSGSTTSFLKVS